MEENTEVVEKPAGHKKKKGKIAAVAILLLMSIAVFLYLGTAYYFKSHFLPNTSIDGIDCSFLTAEDAGKLLREHYRTGYTLDLQGREGVGLAVLTADMLSLEIDFEEMMEHNLSNQQYFRWPFVWFGKDMFSINLTFSAAFDQKELEDALNTLGIFNQTGTQAPKDAYVGEYREEAGRFEIVPETKGTTLDKDLTTKSIGEAIVNLVATLDLEAADCYVKADIRTDDKGLNATLDEMNRLAGSRITYDWNGSQFVLDGNTIHGWVREEAGVVTLQEEAVAEFVAEKAKENDTYGRKREFTTVQGVTLNLRSGAYGWRTDKEAETEALIKLINEGAVTEREPEYLNQGYAKGANDIGNSYVEIDLTNQHLYLFMDGENILETDFVSGDAAGGHLTPSGVFGLTYKTTNAVLRGVDYETPVKYWMPFNGDVGMHDATWRRQFGGEIYLNNGSHGCVNLPLSKAKEIYGYMKTGFPVVCYYY